jgi:hypothetical protein
MGCNSWNAGEASQLPNRKNITQRHQELLDQSRSSLVPRQVNKNRGELPLTGIPGSGRGGDCIRAKYSSKIVGDGLARKSFEREKQAD